MSVNASVEEAFSRHGDRPAVLFDDGRRTERLSYKQLQLMAGKVSFLLMS